MDLEKQLETLQRISDELYHEYGATTTVLNLQSIINRLKKEYLP